LDQVKDVKSVREKKKKLSSAHRIVSQQEQSLKKRPGDKYLDLTPAIHFCEPKFKETGTTMFQSLINKHGSHKDKTNQVDKVIGQNEETRNDISALQTAMKEMKESQQKQETSAASLSNTVKILEASMTTPPHG